MLKNLKNSEFICDLAHRRVAMHLQRVPCSNLNSLACFDSCQFVRLHSNSSSSVNGNDNDNKQQQFQHSTWVQFTSKISIYLLSSIACMHHIYWLCQYLNVYAYRIGDRYGSLAHTLYTHTNRTHWTRIKAQPQSILMWMLIVTRLKLCVYAMHYRERHVPTKRRIRTTEYQNAQAKSSA